MILLDTNLLTRMTRRMTDPQSRRAHDVIGRLTSAKEKLALVPQNPYEFWAVATRSQGSSSGQNGLGMTTAQASQWLAFFQRRFSLLPDKEDLPRIWKALVTAHNIRGFRSHDARLVAAMQTYGITRLLTFNTADFRAFPINVIDPATV